MVVIKNSAVFLWACVAYARMYPVVEGPFLVEKTPVVMRCAPDKHCVDIGRLKMRAHCAKRLMALKTSFPGKRTLLFTEGHSLAGLNAVYAWPQACIVLTKGCPLALARTLGRRVFADYGARLSVFFKLEALPARVVLEGKTATIYEGLCS